MMKFSLILLPLLFATSCIKTAEQVQREKRMSEQMESSQGLMSDVLSQIKDLREQMNGLNGRIEEIEHRQGTVDSQKQQKTAEAMNLLQGQQQTQAQQLDEIRAELKEQRTFLEKVTTTLQGMSKSVESSKKKSPKDELAAALDLVKKDKYSQARTELESLIGSKDLSAGDVNKLYHGLGRVEYYTKNYEKALVYFSKIYTQYPRSSLASNSLLFIGRSLAKLKKTEESKEAFNRLIQDYPNTSDAALAKKEL